jgi:DNA-binding LytR/AlgR family response regulator
LEPDVETAIELRLPATTTGFPTRLVFRDAGRSLGVDVDEIDWIEAAGNYVQIYTPRRVHLVRHTVKAMLEKLDPTCFVRVRPSAIVAVARVTQVVHRPGGEYVITLGSGTQIPSSRGFRAEVERAFGAQATRRG